MVVSNSQDLIKAGMIILVGAAYLTDDGRVIKRVYTDRRGTTLKWQVEGEDIYHRSLWDAYFNTNY